MIIVKSEKLFKGNSLFDVVKDGKVVKTFVSEVSAQLFIEQELLKLEGETMVSLSMKTTSDAEILDEI